MGVFNNEGPHVRAYIVDYLDQMLELEVEFSDDVRTIPRVLFVGRHAAHSCPYFFENLFNRESRLTHSFQKFLCV